MDSSAALNPYAAPISDLLLGQHEVEEIHHYRAYVGKKSDYYLKHWFKLRQGIKSDTGFNLAALFYGPLWFLYRKMYLQFLLLCTVLVVEGVIEHYIFKLSPFSFNTILSVSNLFGLCLSLGCAFYANQFYFNHVTRQIKKARQQEDDDKYVVKGLTRAGGTDYLSPLTLLVALGLMLYAVIIFQPFT